MRKVIISFLIVFLTLVSHTSFTCTGNTMLFHIMSSLVPKLGELIHHPQRMSHP
jgi:hypothetical protein